MTPLLARILACSLLLVLQASPVLSQEKEIVPDKSAREVLEAEEKVEQLIAEKSGASKDGSLGKSTPLSTMLGLRDAMQKFDYEAAGEYLDMRYLPESLQQYNSEQLLRALIYVFSQQNLLDVTHLSDEPAGNLDDGLPDYREKIGEIQLPEEKIPVYLQRIPDGQGGRIWKISNATVSRIPDMWAELGYHPWAFKIGDYLPKFRVLGMENWQAVGAVLSFLLAWPIAALLTAPLARGSLKLRDGLRLPFRRFFRVPMRFFVFILVARWMINQLGLSITAQIYVKSSGVDYLAFTVVVMGIITLARDLQVRKLEREGRQQLVPLMRPFALMVKIVVAIFIALFWANQAGYDMSTILAGLGVGSVAVALAAQKTLENVIGAVTIYVAKPVSPGDFCRFGDVTGTVEEIGLRSTLIRTINRTLVAIPNSMFSSAAIENFTARDHIRYHRIVHLQLGTADQLRLALTAMRKLFLSHPRVLQNTVSLRFQHIEAGTAVIRIDAGVETQDFQDFLAVAEDLNLRMVEAVDELSLDFSGPGQSLRIGELGGMSEEEQARFHDDIARQRDAGKYPFPNFDAEEIETMRASLDYPPRGSKAAS